MGGVPEGTDLLGLAPGRKGLLLHPQRNQLFEMLGCGITAAGLPLLSLVGFLKKEEQ